jgi:hypothetical protein
MIFVFEIITEVTTKNTVFMGVTLCSLVVSSLMCGGSRRMVSPGMLHHVALVRTHVSEERSASIMRVTRIGEVGT